MKSKVWLIFALVTTIFWGVWGAFIEITEQAGFPATLGYVVWSLTMIPPALIALKLVDWEIEYDKRSILLGTAIGFLGAGGQLILFHGVSIGPAYIIFPIIALSPVITVLLSILILKEKTNTKGWIGIILALIAIPLLSYQPPDNTTVEGYWWLVLALGVFFAWGIQGFFMKFANETMSAESIFFYMALTGVLLSPIAIMMTDFSQEINWGFKGPYLAFLIQILNSIGALCLVFAYRYGKAIVVSPLTNAIAPVITIVISLVLYSVFPHTVTLIGMIVAIIATFLLAIVEESTEQVEEIDEKVDEVLAE
ncbi:MAG: EamA family transporter [Balneolaceae bacterium]|nr:EamA family transporter [Balneolaceae bacterium]